MSGRRAGATYAESPWRDSPSRMPFSWPSLRPSGWRLFIEVGIKTHASRGENTPIHTVD
jgi:hypothetical protein